MRSTYNKSKRPDRRTLQEIEELLEKTAQGRIPLTQDQVLTRLKRIRDYAITWTEGCLIDGKFTGSSAASMLYTHAVTEIERLQGGTRAAGVEIRVNGIDVSKLDFGPPSAGPGDGD